MKQYTDLAAAGAMLAAFLVFGGGATARAQEEPAFKSGSNEVLVDVVVRDKRGRPVRDLKQGELTILENGVQQAVTSFREVRSAGALAPDLEPRVQTSGAVAEKPNQLQLTRQIRLVSLVFLRVGMDSRRLARQAALDFLKNDLGGNVYYAVFIIDRDFRTIVPYTNDKESLRLGIEMVTGNERTAIANDAKLLLERTPGLSGGGLGSGVAAMIKAMNDFNNLLDAEMFGRIAIFKLWGIVKELSRLPGRKSVLLFAEGLPMPNGMWSFYRAMLSDANRANVSFYTIDAKGLVVGSDQEKSRYMLEQGAAQSVETVLTVPSTPFQERNQVMGYDMAMDSIKGNGQMNLLDLAESTGGFLIANTNDFRGPLRKLSEDFNTYYEVSYRPKDQSYDGRFRAIGVQVSRKDVTVQARNGYYALPLMPGQAVFPYEAPLLQALGKPAPGRGVEFRAAVLQYRQREGREQASLVFDMPMRGITFVKDEKTQLMRAHVSVLALVKDADGQVAMKLSRDVPVMVPPDRVAEFQRGRLVVTRAMHLPPGRYTVESVAADNEGNRSAVKRSVVVIPPNGVTPGLSDIALVRRVEKTPETPEENDPLIAPAGKVVPTLAGALQTGVPAQLFVTAYPEPGAKAELIVDLLKDGKVVARNRVDLPAASATGEVPYLAYVPHTALAPGQYELRAALVQGEKGARRSVMVDVE